MMKASLTLLIAACSGFATADKLSLTPPMGWMSWEVFRCRTDCTGTNEGCESQVAGRPRRAISLAARAA